MTDQPPGDDGYFGEDVAATYDAATGPEFDPAVIESTVAFLAELAGSGRALEFAIGTGRIALPLAARGIPVAGIDLSRAMVARLREKPGSDALEVEIGDFTSTRMPGEFSLVYLVFNTIENVTSQAGQVATFRNAATHLSPGGRFVVEVGTPALDRLPQGGRHVVSTFGDTHVCIDEYDVLRQGLISHHFHLRERGWERTSVPFRYAWPAELDLMADAAGMALSERWADWTREPFTSESPRHISVWTKRA